MNDNNAVLRHVKTATVLNEIAANPRTFRNDDTFADDRMPNFCTRSHAHSGH
jgi:hypothetical protein